MGVSDNRGPTPARSIKVDDVGRIAAHLAGLPALLISDCRRGEQSTASPRASATVNAIVRCRSR